MTPLLVLLLASGWLAQLASADIENLSQLYNAIEAGPNRKVGFLSIGNYQVVKNTLPSTAEPVVVGSVDLLSQFVQNGTFLAGLVTQVPPTGFNQFPSGILSPQTMMLASNASSLLRQALDAAVVRVIQSGGPFQFARNNPPIVVTEANSCSADGAFYPFPTATELANEPWFQQGVIKIAALGPFDWGNTGDYLSSPPAGFWPEYYEAISQELKTAYGSGFNGLTRVFYPTSDGVLGSITSGATHATEPYFVVDGSYQNRGRSYKFAFSCFAMASGSTFFSQKGGSPAGPVLSDGAYAGIASGAFALILGGMFIVLMIFKERRGEPLFTPLKDHDDFEVTGSKHSSHSKDSNHSGSDKGQEMMAKTGVNVTFV